jgi:hypothetical protein
MGTTQVPPKNKWTKKNGVYEFRRILLSLKKKEILSFATTWINLKVILLNETNMTLNHMKRDTQCSAKLSQNQKMKWVAKGWGRGI